LAEGSGLKNLDLILRKATVRRVELEVACRRQSHLRRASRRRRVHRGRHADFNVVDRRMNKEQSWRAGRTERRGGHLNGTNTRRGANGIEGGIPSASAGEAVGGYIEDSGIAGGKGERWRDRCAGTILSTRGEQQGGSHLHGKTGAGVQ